MGDTSKFGKTNCNKIIDLLTVDNTEDVSDDLFSGNDRVS